MELGRQILQFHLRWSYLELSTVRKFTIEISLFSWILVLHCSSQYSQCKYKNKYVGIHFCSEPRYLPNLPIACIVTITILSVCFISCRSFYVLFKHLCVNMVLTTMHHVIAEYWLYYSCNHDAFILYYNVGTGSIINDLLYIFGTATSTETIKRVTMNQTRFKPKQYH